LYYEDKKSEFLALQGLRRRGVPVARAGWMLALTLCLVGWSTLAGASVQLQRLALDGDNGSATLTLGLSATVHANVFMLAHPWRLVVDLPATRMPAALRTPAPAGPVLSLHQGLRSDGTLRLVMTLRAPVQHQLSVRPGASPGSSVLQLVLIGHDTAAAPAAPKPLARALPPSHAPASTDRNIIVVIDAGHGGMDPGASGPDGTHEKDVTLAIAQALAARIDQEPGMHAILTRDSDRFILLPDRMRLARAAHADLFVSIHADSVPNSEITGASVYVLSERGASSEAASWLADRENAADLKGGVSLSTVDAKLATVLLDVSQSAQIGTSTEAADRVVEALDQVGAVRKREVQHAAFVVLKAPDVPSMLIETAYISNPGEERKLRTPEYQQRLADAICRGLSGYFRTHPPEGTLFARQRHGGTEESPPPSSSAPSPSPQG
jgi:N-acetylmuramoyl-L-alanine amidase